MKIEKLERYFSRVGLWALAACFFVAAIGASGLLAMTLANLLLVVTFLFGALAIHLSEAKLPKRHVVVHSAVFGLVLVLCSVGLAHWKNKDDEKLASQARPSAPTTTAQTAAVLPMLQTSNSNHRSEISTDERRRRQILLQKIRAYYIASHDGISPKLAAGLENPPSAWVNEQLKEMGETWRVPEPHGSKAKAPASSAGSITQGEGSIAQIGGSGNNAIITNNFGPQTRFPEQRIPELASLLSSQHGSVSISVKNPDSIINRDATNLLTAFAKARWTTQGVDQEIHGTDIGADGLPIPDPIGIHIYAGTEPSDSAEFVKMALKQFGLDSHKELDKGITDSRIVIVVGRPE